MLFSSAGTLNQMAIILRSAALLGNLKLLQQYPDVSLKLASPLMLMQCQRSARTCATRLHLRWPHH